MSHYETFVIRVWVDDDAHLDHGEVRHLTSGMGLRFRRVHEATRFIERVAPGTQAENVQRPTTLQAEG